MKKSQSSNYRWLIVALLFFATTINYLDRQVISLLKPTLAAEFGWTESIYAQIVMAFTLSYGIGTLFAGYFIDKIGTKIGYATSIVVWSLAAMAHSLAKTNVGFMFARASLGIGEAGNFPASIKTVSDWFPAKERALAVGLFNSGTNIGAVVAPLFVPWLAMMGGWQFAFIVTGLMGFVWLIAWWFLYEKPEAHNDQVPLETIENQANKGTYADIFKNRAIWGFVFGKLFTDPIWWFFLFWLPAYLTDIYHLDLKKMGTPLVIIYLAATIGSVGGGWLSSMLIKKGWSETKARLTCMLGFAFCVTPVMLISQVADFWIVVAILCLAVSAHQAWSANLFATVADKFENKVVSRVVGIGTMAGTLGGTLFPLLVGYILDYYKSINQLSGGYTVIFYMAGFAYLIAWLLLRYFVKSRGMSHEL